MSATLTEELKQAFEAEWATCKAKLLEQWRPYGIAGEAGEEMVEALKPLLSLSAEGYAKGYTEACRDCSEAVLKIGLKMESRAMRDACDLIAKHLKKLPE